MFSWCNSLSISLQRFNVASTWSCINHQQLPTWGRTQQVVYPLIKVRHLPQREREHSKHISHKKASLISINSSIIRRPLPQCEREHFPRFLKSRVKPHSQYWELGTSNATPKCSSMAGSSFVLSRHIIIMALSSCRWTHWHCDNSHCQNCQWTLTSSRIVQR